jgi:hypothetical protein
MLAVSREEGGAHTELNVVTDVRTGRAGLQRGHGDGRKPGR